MKNFSYNRRNGVHFTIWMTGFYAENKNLSSAEVYQLFEKYGVFEYLYEFWEPLHSVTPYYVLGDIDEFIEIRRGNAKS